MGEENSVGGVTAAPPSVFRPVYRKLTEEEQVRIDAIKNKAQELLLLVEGGLNTTGVINGRHIALAKTALEESVMWAVKAVSA